MARLTPPRALLDEIGLVVDHSQRDALRKRLADVDQRRPHGRRDGDGIGAELFDHAAADDFAGQPMGDTAPDGGRLDHVRDVAEHDRDSFLDRDDRRSELVDGLHAADGAHRPFRAALRDESAGRVDVRVLDGVQHFVQRDVPRRHAGRIDLNLELPEIAAEPLDRGDTRDGEQPVLQLELGQVPERHQVHGAGFGFEREFENLVQPAGEARQQRSIGAGRELRSDLTDTLGDELPGPVVVRVASNSTVTWLTPSCDEERMRRTSGSPASAVSIGIATEASSSSAPIAGFCTMTLKTGADKSGKTSRRSC